MGFERDYEILNGRLLSLSLLRVKAYQDRLEILALKEPPNVFITLDNANVIVVCEIRGQAFSNKIPFTEFNYCMEADDREVYMLRMFCRKCTNFIYCASVKKSLSECEGDVFTPSHSPA